MSDAPDRDAGQRAFNRRLLRVYGLYTIGFLAFVGLLALLEQGGLPRATIGYAFLAATIVLYAAIGILSRTSDATEYYVAGRRVPAMFNGMATAADWMSAASFIGLAGGLYLQGYAGLAFVMGWTGGYVLVGLLLAPYLRRFGQFTIPDFLGARYGGHVPRFIGLVLAIGVSFLYVVAQIYGVGLITTRLTGVDFGIGVFLGLAGILVCSFLGGMKAVTWTQVAQYIVLLVAYLIPVGWLAMQQTGLPFAPFVYGDQLRQVTVLEQKLVDDPKEREVRRILAERAKVAEDRLRDVPRALADSRAALERMLVEMRVAGESPEDIRRVEEAIVKLPRDPRAARDVWTREQSLAARAQPPLRHGEAFPGRDEAARDAARKNFLALVFCLMVGTAGLPHILMRYYTTPSVAEARRSVTWSLFFILLLYLTAPALAVLVKHVVYHDLVGSSFAALPAWVQAWTKVDPTLVSIADINRDGIVQLAEISLGQDIVVLATPEIAGLPYVVAGLVAAGGLAAALSTADGLLLTIASALSHDLYYRMIDPKAPTARRVLLSKMLLLVVAILAALVAAQKPADILFVVSAAFSLAASAFFPALVLGIFWKRATGLGAVTGMLAGFGTSFWYMATTQPWLRRAFGLAGDATGHLWWDIQPIAAGVFGVPAGFATIIAVSLLTPAPSRQARALVDALRAPGG